MSPGACGGDGRLALRKIEKNFESDLDCRGPFVKREPRAAALMISAALEQHFCHVDAAMPVGKVQRRLAVIVLGIHIGALGRAVMSGGPAAPVIW